MATVNIRTYDELVAVLVLQKNNLPTYQAAVGATAADIAAVNSELLNLEYLKEYAEVVDANKKTVFQMKAALYNGDMDEPIANFPVFAAGDFPDGAVAGCLERATIRNKRLSSGRVITRRSASLWESKAAAEARFPKAVTSRLSMFLPRRTITPSR